MNQSVSIILINTRKNHCAIKSESRVTLNRNERERRFRTVNAVPLPATPLDPDPDSRYDAIDLFVTVHFLNLVPVCFGAILKTFHVKIILQTRNITAIVPKPSIHQRKVLLCLWWDRKGPVYYKLLKQGKTINADLYCNQLDKLNAVIKQKMPALASRKGIMFHHDNARLLTAMVTQQKLNALEWEVLRHPPYSPDIAPSD
ncbi:histone-lysine N-methyltransferase SETMAR [Trichonephila clavipes]|nr:histone-lysine N-methyltransferase SETMAR [Trichonephila clavipes]